MLLTPDAEDANWFRDRGILVKPVWPMLDVPLRRERIFSAKMHLFGQDMKKWRKIIYLDSDLLIKGPFPELLETDSFSAIEGWQFRKMSDRFYGRGFWQKHHKNQPTFNGGIWCFNTDLINKNTLKLIRRCCRENKKYYANGGAVENTLVVFLLENNVKIDFLPLEFNTPIMKIPEKDMAARMRQAKILHFVGNFKCWNVNNVFFPLYLENLLRAEQIENVSLVQPVNEIDWNSHVVKLL